MSLFFIFDKDTNDKEISFLSSQPKKIIKKKGEIYEVLWLI